MHLIVTLKNLNFYDTGARNGNSFQAKHPKLVATSLGSGRPLLSVQNGPERKVARTLQSRASSGRRVKEAGRSALGAVAHSRGHSERVPVLALHARQVVRTHVKHDLTPVRLRVGLLFQVGRARSAVTRRGFDRDVQN